MNKAKAEIAVVMPCYNTKPSFLQEAIDSVVNNAGAIAYKIIIVDDGSADKATLQFLKSVNDEKIQVIFQSNKGPAAARNSGVTAAEAEYILFLDSDDRLLPGYITEGITRLKANKKAGVVYANAFAFGDKSRKNFESKPFEIATLLIQNFIPMCAVIRKKAWENTGGIDENLVQYEDWEFWINIYKAGWEFVFINKPMFEYRIQIGSLIAQQPEIKFKSAVGYIYKKHYDLVYKVFQQLYAARIMYQNDMKKPLRSFMKYAKNNLSKKQSV